MYRRATGKQYSSKHEYTRVNVAKQKQICLFRYFEMTHTAKQVYDSKILSRNGIRKVMRLEYSSKR